MNYDNRLTMKKILFIAGVLFSVLQSASQDYYDMANYGVTPGSAEAQAAKAVSDIPVNLSTGIPSINIPIGSISGKSVQMPIQISYNAIGIKVEQKASFVGLGWSLMAGGQITRKVRGWPDECPEWPNAADGGGVNNHISLRALPNGGYLNNTVPDMYDDNNGDHRDKALRTITGLLDLQPDEFYFNFLNYSGMFVFDESGEAQLVPEQNLKVTYDEVGFSWFQIEDENGFTYKFADVETTSSTNSCTSNWSSCSESSNYSSWHLSEIKNAYGEIEFIIEYHDEISIMSSDIYETTEIYLGDNCPPPVHQYCTISHYQEIKHVEKIIGNGYYAEFHLGAIREDVIPDKVLDRIKFFLEDDTFLGEKVFNYSYFGSGESNTSVRLRLDSVQEINSSLQTLPPTKFIYNSQLLPQYGSKAIDHWGFSNGRVSSILLFPSLIPSIDGCSTTRDPYETNKIKSST